ncbi:MAG: hypothetical protein V1646_01270 [bacterium]
MNKKIVKINKRILLFLIFVTLIMGWEPALPVITVPNPNIEVVTIPDPNIEVVTIPDSNIEVVTIPDNTIIRDDSTVVNITRAIFPALLNAVYIDTNNNIYYSSNISTSSPTWTKIDGAAYEIALGTDGKMLVVGTNYASDGVIYESAGISGVSATWAALSGTRATKVAMSTNGQAVHINSAHSIYYRANSTSGWVQIDWLGVDVAIGPDGKMIMAGVDFISAGRNSGKIGQSNGVVGTSGNWSTMAGTEAYKVAIGTGGQSVCIGGSNAVYYRVNSSSGWVYQSGLLAKEISMVSNNATAAILYIDSTDNKMYLYDVGTKTKVLIPPFPGTIPKKVAINTNSTIKTNLDALTSALASTTLGIGVSSDVWPTQKTMFSIVKFFDSIFYQGANGGNAIYDKLKSFYDARTASANTSDLTYLTNLRALLTASVGKNFLTTTAATGVVPQSTNVSNWLAQVVTDMTTPGGTKFLFDPSKGIEKAYYAVDKWLVSTPNYMVVKFKAQAANDIYVHFVADAGTASSTNYVRLNIGGLGNTKTWLRNCFNGTSTDINIIADAVAVTSSTLTDYWIKIMGNTLTYGRSVTIGTNQKGSWTIPGALKNLKYVGFGGYNQPVTYTNISIASLSNEEINKYEFSIALDSANTLSLLNTLVGAGASATTKAVYNTLSYLANYPSTDKSIYTKIKSFYDAKSDTTLSAVKDLLIASAGKKFLTGIVATATAPATLQQFDISDWLTQVTNASLKLELTSILGDSTKSGTPVLLNTNLISIDKFNFATFQGANGGDQIYAKLQSFFNVRGSLNLNDLKTLLTNSASPTTNLLTATQKAMVSKWLDIVKIEVELKTDIDGLTKDNVANLLGDTTKVAKVRTLRAKRASLP